MVGLQEVEPVVCHFGSGSQVLERKGRLTLPSSLHHQLQSEQELEVLSVLPPGWQPDEPVVPRPFLLVPSTRVTFLAWQYRFVIELDLSPSTGIVVRGWLRGGSGKKGLGRK